MRQYLDLMKHVLENGTNKQDRTGTGTLSVFGYQMRFNLGEGFPLLTTKKLHIKSIIYELLWFLRGDTNVKYLKDHGVTIWNEWADEHGNLGPVYGKQWRQWAKTSPLRDGLLTGPPLSHLSELGEGASVTPMGPRVRGKRSGFDQIEHVINEIKKNPDSRRLIVNAWNVLDINSMA